MKIFTYDTETSYDPTTSTAWVWSWGLCDEDLTVTLGDGLNFLTALCKLPDDSEVWVHNLSFDGEFILYEAIAQGFKIAYDVDERYRFHGVVIVQEDISGIRAITLNYGGKRIVLRDSFRLFRCALSKIPKICGFESIDHKGDAIDYEVIRPRNWKSTVEEQEYQAHDVTVLMRGIKWIKALGEGNTIGSIALNDFKRHVGKTPFKSLTPADHAILSSLYSGGKTWVNPQYANRHIISPGWTIDRNSMYPAEAVNTHPVAVRAIRDGRTSGGDKRAYLIQCTDLRVKAGHFPVLVRAFGAQSDYVTLLEKWIYEPELDYLCAHYNYKTLRVVKTAEFECSEICRSWVEKWYRVKQAEPDRREFAKLMLNNLTGKIAQNPVHEEIRRFWRDGSFNLYRYNPPLKLNKFTFMPWTASVTSDSRLCLASTVGLIGVDHCFYTDTDSVHGYGELPQDIIDQFALGAWKKENDFDEAIYIKNKCYFETQYFGKTVQRSAGLSLSDIHADTGAKISPENMRSGEKFICKQNKRVKGGVALLPIIKTI